MTDLLCISEEGPRRSPTTIQFNLPTAAGEVHFGRIMRVGINEMASQCTLKTPQGPRYFLPLEMLIVSTVAVNINYIAANNGSSEALLRIKYSIH